MDYTSIPSVKGQVTIPAAIREKYQISQNTPLKIKDSGKGIITIRVMNMVDHDQIHYYENDKEIGLTFKKGIDPQLLIDELNKIDG